MGCNCGKRRRFEVTFGDGTKQVVDTQAEAVRLAAANNGVWRLLT